MEGNTHPEFAYVLACADPKIRRRLEQKFDERFGAENYFFPTELGGVKNLASPEEESDRDYLLRKIRVAMKVHPLSVIILVNHSDCLAYNLAGHRFEDAKAEEALHKKELEEAAEIIKNEFPDIEVETHYFLKKEQQLRW